ncbi:hypothetical protein FZ938_14385 [Azospirillum oryzae]|nr:hypothetical protein FZ938_14385 [Azospirillum oryzae]
MAPGGRVSVSKSSCGADSCPHPDPPPLSAGRRPVRSRGRELALVRKGGGSPSPAQRGRSGGGLTPQGGGSWNLAPSR